MSLDSRSRERLEQLGRQLPQPLPVPDPPARGRKAASEPRHPVETEQDPEELFRQLMAASPDGTVPPHLLERLRRLEAAPPPPASGAGSPSAKAQRTTTRSRPPAASSGTREPDLYASFAQLLLEDEDEDLS